MGVLDARRNRVSPTLPGYLSLLALSALASRRVPALRPVAWCFAAWAALDAVTGPPWLRAGILVAWPGAAVALALAAWGLEPRRPSGKCDRVPCGHRFIDKTSTFGEGNIDFHASVGEGGDLFGTEPTEKIGSSDINIAHAQMMPLVACAVYLLAGVASALAYRAHAPGLYHAALPVSRALPVALAGVALGLCRWPRTWVARAVVAPALGLAVGVVAGVWALLPAGLGVMREQWARLAGAETWLTLAVTAGCVAMAWWQARRVP